MLLGASYLCAFASLGVQVIGLIGEQGILPAGDYLAWTREQHGGETWLHFPTLLHWGCSNRAITAYCAVGIALSISLIGGVAVRLCLAVLWLLYLSLTVAAGSFLQFQWDSLLLETGFLAWFFAPRGIWPARWQERPSTFAKFLLSFLLFKLMFSSGVTKLMSGDPTWANHTALTYHFWTQPLPSWISHHAHHVPAGLQQFATALVLVIEVVLPFLIFGPRALRLLAAIGFIGLQVAISLTGNYGFFNLLTLALCTLLIDDATWHRMLRLRLPEVTVPARRSLAVRVPAAVVGGLLLALSVGSMLPDIAPDTRIPTPARTVIARAQDLRITSGYGLFRVMTTDRPELVLEGSMDGSHWEPYELAYKPGDPRREPAIAGFHMPRLDWMLWFEALRAPYREQLEPTVAFRMLQKRLLEGVPAVQRLFAEVPFDGQAPRVLRARLYGYRFSSGPERRAGLWWRRTERGEYASRVMLQSDRLVQVW